ncbi:MAG: type II 3-dehydroquinate dehydratase [Hyphomicrobiales bacterium]|nr:type II 3-dehydroquinate dehydratase [Hyphomicrobiales bacterium]
MAPKIHILNGPNLDRLGQREPDVYGDLTLADIERRADERAKARGFAIVFRQSNHEGQLIDWIHEAGDSAGIILNAGAYTHTSIALHDAIKSVAAPVIEVHLSNVFAREPFRHHSTLSPVVRGVICGFGGNSYCLAIDALADLAAQ